MSNNKESAYTLIHLTAVTKVTVSKQPPELIAAKLSAIDKLFKSVSLYESYGIERWLMDAFVEKRLEGILESASISELEMLPQLENHNHDRADFDDLPPEEELILRTIIFLWKPFPKDIACRYEHLRGTVSSANGMEEANG